MCLFGVRFLTFRELFSPMLWPADAYSGDLRLRETVDVDDLAASLLVVSPSLTTLDSKFNFFIYLQCYHDRQVKTCSRQSERSWAAARRVAFRCPR